MRINEFMPFLTFYPLFLDFLFVSLINSTDSTRISGFSPNLQTRTTNMGRMHNPGKGISRSALPYRRSVPNWLKLTNTDVEEHIERLARKGLRPSQIGVVLRDSHGVAQVRRVTGNKIVRILKKKVGFLAVYFARS